MRWFYQPLLLLLASSTDSDLAKQVEYLKAENQILRRLVGKRPYLDEPDKRLLVKLGQAVGKGIKDLLSIVSYPTYRRWVGLYDPAGAGTNPAAASGKGGRPRTLDEIREGSSDPCRYCGVKSGRGPHTEVRQRRQHSNHPTASEAEPS